MELHYTNIGVQTFDTSSAVKGSADFQSLTLWARGRSLISITLVDRPLRSVLELAHAELPDDLQGVLGFNSLASVGTGIELDRSASDPIFSHARVVFRY